MSASRIGYTLFLGGLLLLPGSALAGEIVHFDDGRSLRVTAIEFGQPMSTLELEGGGKMAIPTARIRATEPWSAPAPVAALPVVAEAWRAAAGPYADLIGGAARRHRIDPAVLTAMAHVESAFDPLAVSPKGAGGLLQLMPETARRFGVDDVFDVAQNLEGGARYFSWLLDRYGSTELALAGYNAGEGSVDQYQGIPPYRETRHYVDRVLSRAVRLDPSGHIHP